MEKVNYIRTGESIPLKLMPLNINFIKLDNRVITYDKYRGTMEPSKLSKMGLFFSDISPVTLNCYFCGQPSTLTKDGSLPCGNIYHSKLCPLVPPSLPNERVPVTDNVLEFIAAQISKLSHALKNNLLDVGEVKDGNLKSLNVDEEDEDEKNEEEARVNEQRAAQIEEFGFALDCSICGKNMGYIKCLTDPCGHMPYCIECAKFQSKCSRCDQDISSLMPMFWE